MIKLLNNNFSDSELISRWPVN